MEVLERAQNILRKAELRVTGTRVALVGALLRSNQPVSMEDAVQLCGNGGGDPATVYRNLQALREAGVLQPVRGVGRREMFELCEACLDESHHHHHAHLSCTRCGRVVCIELPDQPPTPAPRGWKIDDVTVTVWGLCPECS